ncbi:unnamed protein product [Paramecium octaurelia]|uniref:Uncharacterized protein n=1 Tax=Paramecium octaurelia TaxID=43137 RepID=A0A8S1XDU4_PAROT|nr:unnamed protein product [Paramecium octaurelia]CAD8199224.1 unnamed protein product [Paramecium octaurelia]
MDHFLYAIKSAINQLEIKQPRYAPIYYILTSSLMFSINSMLSKMISHIASSQIVFFRAIIMFLINFAVTSNQNIKLYGFTSKIIYEKHIWMFRNNLFLCRYYVGQCVRGSSSFQNFSSLDISYGDILFENRKGLDKSIYQLGCMLFWNLSHQLASSAIRNVRLSKKGKSSIDLNEWNNINVVCCYILINNTSINQYFSQDFILQYFSIISIVLTSVTLFITPAQQWLVPNYLEMSMLTLIGSTSYIIQLLMNRAYMKGNLTEISMLGQSQVIYGYVIDMFMGTNLSIFSICGTGVIVASLVKVVFDKSKQEKGH